MEPLSIHPAGLAGPQPVAALAGDPAGVPREPRGVASGGPEPALLGALRAAVGSERPMGELLAELAGHLRDAARAGGEGAASAGRLASELEGHLVRPGAGGAELRALLARAGHGYEALLLAALRGRDPRASGELADELADHVRRLLLAREAAPTEASAVARVRGAGADLHDALARALAKVHAASAGRPELAAALRSALEEALRASPANHSEALRAAAEEAVRALLREPAGEALARRAFGLPPREGLLAAPAEELAERLAAELLRRVEGAEPAAARLAHLARALGPPASRALEAALAAVRLPGGGAPAPARLLEALEGSLARVLEAFPEALRAEAAREPAELWRAVFAGPAGESLARRLAGLAGIDGGDPAHAARGDLKAALLAAWTDLPEGPARAALARALAGLESEQLLNLARRELGEASHVALPIVVGAHWATLHLLRHPRRGAGSGSEAPLERVGLALELSNLGPVRAELGWREGELRVRLIAASREVADRLRAGAASLEARLAAGGERVELRVAEAQAGELGVERLALDVGYLREHQLLDLSG